MFVPMLLLARVFCSSRSTRQMPVQKMYVSLMGDAGALLAAPFSFFASESPAQD